MSLHTQVSSRTQGLEERGTGESNFRPEPTGGGVTAAASCKPCLSRGRIALAEKSVNGEPWCWECFYDRPKPKEVKAYVPRIGPCFLCDRQRFRAGYCVPHYQRVKKFGKDSPRVMEPIKVMVKNIGPCSLGCGRKSTTAGMCNTHYRQQLRLGKTGEIRVYRKATRSQPTEVHA